MSRSLRIYYYGVFGALGGLLAWRVTDAYLVLGRLNIYLIDAILGGMIGLLVGGFIQASDGLVSRTWMRAAIGFVSGALIGALGGAVGLPAGEWAFQQIGGEVAGRVVGWAIFGIAIGLAES